METSGLCRMAALGLLGFLAGCCHCSPRAACADSIEFNSEVVPATAANTAAADGERIGADQQRNETFFFADAHAGVAENLTRFAVDLLQQELGEDLPTENMASADPAMPGQLGLVVRQASIYLRRGEETAAIAMLQKLCAENPDSAEAHICLAQIHRVLRNHAEALAAARQAVQLNPASPMPCLYLALLLEEFGEEQQAVELLEDALWKVADQLPLLRLLGDYYAKHSSASGHAPPDSDLKKAIDYYARAASLPDDDDSPAYLSRLSELYIRTGQYNKARQCLYQLLELAPASVEVLKSLVRVSLEQGQVLEAVEYLRAFEQGRLSVDTASAQEDEPAADQPVRDLTAGDAEDFFEHFLKLMVFLARNDISLAGETVTWGLKHYSDRFAFLEIAWEVELLRGDLARADAVGRLLPKAAANSEERASGARRLASHAALAEECENIDQAAAFYRQAIELDPDFAEGYLRLAALCISHSRAAEGMAVLEDACARFDNHAMSLFLLGVLYSGAHRAEEAMEVFERALDAASLDHVWFGALGSELYFIYGATCEQAGNCEQAEYLLRQAIQAAPDNHEALNYLAYCWAEKGENLGAALDLVQQALELKPEEGAYLDTLGWIYFKMGRPEEALAEIYNALEYLPRDATVLEHCGDVYWALGRVADATHWWRKSYEANPENTGLQEKLRERGVLAE